MDTTNDVGQLDVLIISILVGRLLRAYGNATQDKVIADIYTNYGEEVVKAVQQQARKIVDARTK